MSLRGAQRRGNLLVVIPAPTLIPSEVAFTPELAEGGGIYLNHQSNHFDIQNSLLNAAGSPAANSIFPPNLDRFTLAEYSINDSNEALICLRRNDLGNRDLIDVRDGNNVDYVIDANTNRYTQIGGSSPQYDAAGNLVKDYNSYECEYDYENRITKITKSGPTTVAEFAYVEDPPYRNALGRRICKFDWLAWTGVIYYYNDKWQVLCEYDALDGNFQQWYAYGNGIYPWGIDEVLIKGTSYATSSFQYYLHDHLYSPVAITSWSGVPAERYEYDAYGNPHILEPDFSPDPDGKSDCSNSYLFTGRELDIFDSGSLKIQYNRNRYYDSYTGRWTTHDPLGITPNQWEANRLAPVDQYNYGSNLYEYISSNPVDRLDASGSGPFTLPILSILHEVFEYCHQGSGKWLIYQAAKAGAKAANPQCWPGGLTAFGAGNPYAHCVWSCKVAKKNGKAAAKKCNRLKEDFDWAVADYADSIRDSCWKRLPGFYRKNLADWSCSAFQRSDFKDNATGRDCGTSECVKTGAKTCEDCCGKSGITSNTPEGNEERPYSRRCRPRYLNEMPRGSIAEGWGPGK